MDNVPTKDLFKAVKKTHDEVGQLIDGLTPAIEKVVNEKVNEQIDKKVTPVLNKTLASVEEERRIAKHNRDESNSDKEHQRRFFKARTRRAGQLAGQWIKYRHHSYNYGGHKYFVKKLSQIRSAIGTYYKDTFVVNSVDDIRQNEYKKVMDWVMRIKLFDLNSSRFQDEDTALDELNKWEKRHGYPLTQPDD